MTPQNQALLVLEKRARRILSAWTQGNLEELRSVMGESAEGVASAHAREHAEAVDAVGELLCTWLCAPEGVPMAELQAALGLLRHLAGFV